MLKPTNKITPDLLVTDIVASDYRSAEIFRKYNIDFCCGGKMLLTSACELKGLNHSDVLEDLMLQADCTQNMSEWPVDFMIDYLINVHHNYFKASIPVVEDYINRFAASHIKKFPEKQELPLIFSRLSNSLSGLMNYEKDTLFPYTKKIIFASKNSEEFGKLLIRTSRKFSKEDIVPFHGQIQRIIFQLEQITDGFSIPENACLTHKVMLLKLKEFTKFIAYHLYIEAKTLIPEVLRIESSLMKKSIKEVG